MDIRVLTYNIHKGVGGVDRRLRPDRTIETIAHYHPDIVLLQEVTERCPVPGMRMVDYLARGLKFRHYAYFSNVTLLTGVTYGNAILSHFPIVESQNLNLTIGRRKPRSALHAWIRVRLPESRKTRTLHVFNLHIGLSAKEREQQIQRFVEGHPFARMHHRTPIVVGGDFNDLWRALGPKYLSPLGFRGTPADLKTFPAWAPTLALDAFYARGDIDLRRVGRGRTELAKRASDHLPLIADLSIGPLDAHRSKE